MYDYKKALIPYPQKIEDGGALKLIAVEARPYYKLEIANVPSEVFASAVEIIEEALCGAVMPVEGPSMDVLPANERAGEYVIKFGVCTCAGDRADSYTIDITDEKATILGYDAGGAYYAAVTFAKLITCDRGNIYLPITKITDYPDFIDRGQFLEDRYGSDFMTLDDYKKAVKYLAAMKYNQLTVGIYGCWGYQYDNIIQEYQYIPFKKYPQLTTPRNIKYYSVAERKWIYKKEVLPTMFNDDYFGDLVAYGKKHNVKVKPLFNSLGHNTLIPRMIPEISAKNENGELTGKGFCTNNPQTYEVMFDLYDEIIDRYLTPNGVDGFQVGLDEVPESNFCKCEKCRSKTKADLMIDYVIELCKHLKKKGMKSVYIYHDMFFRFGVLNKDMYKRFEEAGVADVAVIDWWSYRVDADLFDGGKELDTSFRGIIKPFNGYYHWQTPMEYNDSIYGCAKRAKKYGFEGIESYSSFEYCYDRTFKYQADLSWNINELENREFFYDRYAYEFCPDDYEAARAALNSTRIIMEALLSSNLMNGLDYYWYSYKGLRDSNYPTNYPGGVLKRYNDGYDVFAPYAEKTMAEAKKAIDFFGSNLKSDAFMNRTWLLTATHYYNNMNFFSTVVELYRKNANKCEIYAAFKELLRSQEEFMLLSETTRIPANMYIYQRNATIIRQFILDTLKYCEETPDDEFKFEIEDLRYLKTDVYYAIR